jgi:hypothetical protein
MRRGTGQTFFSDKFRETLHAVDSRPAARPRMIGPLFVEMVGLTRPHGCYGADKSYHQETRSADGDEVN